jgi:phosphoglycolate phosphatase-like HAD superfamily hydrolase
MNNMSYPWKAVAFDCDGVIVDSFQLADDILAAICRDRGISYESPTTLRAAFEVPNPWSYLDEVLDIQAADVMKPLDDGYKTVPIFPAVAEAIRSLRQVDSPPRLIVLTANKSSTVRQRLATEQLDQHFDLIWGSDTPGLPSGKAARLQHFTAQHGIPPSECCFVGDTRSDIDAGNAAGVFTIGVCWGGFHPEAALSDANRVVRAPEKLSECLALA